MIWCRLHKDAVDSSDLVQASQGRRIVDSGDLVQASQGRRIVDSGDLVQASQAVSYTHLTLPTRSTV